MKNLMEIYSCITGKSMEEIEGEFAGKGYGDFKPAVAEAVIGELRPIQERFKEILQDKDYLQRCCRENAEKAGAIAQRTVSKAMKKIGFLPMK